MRDTDAVRPARPRQCWRTPVATSRTLDERAGASVFLKCENLQRMGAFKFRGAYNTISRLAPEALRDATAPAPLMIMYHVNPGFPLLDAGSRLVLNASHTRP